MTPQVLLVHGWALGPDLWDAVTERLSLPAVRLDLGYYGAPNLDDRPSGRFIAVGHSFGVLWLLRHWPEGCAGLVAVNGFARFAAGDDFAEGSPRRPLQRMIQRFDAEPAAVTADFLQRCGAPPAPLDGLEASRAAAGLQGLRDWDARDIARDLDVPVIALLGQDDPIAPPPLSLASFAHCRQLETRVLPGQGHMLPLSAPQACADAVTALAEAAA